MENTSNLGDFLDLLGRLKSLDLENISESTLSGCDQQVVDYVEELHQFLSYMKSNVNVLDEQATAILSSYRKRIQSMTKISEATSEIAGGAQKQSATAAKCESLAQRFQEKFETMVDSTKNIKDDADKAKEISQNSEEMFRELLERSRDSQSLFLDMVEKIISLVKTAENVDKIVSAIIRIARQTNLLSINATIEAARAGVAGKGFAVVAGEIKKLADDTQKSGADISELISGISNELNDIKEVSMIARESFQSQDASIENASHALGNIQETMNTFLKQQISFNKEFDNLFQYNQSLGEAIAEITKITEDSVAICNAVASITMEQTSQDNVLLDMLSSQKDTIESLEQRVQPVNVRMVARGRKRIGFTALEQVAFYADVENAVKETCEKLGIDVVCKTPASYDVSEQLDIFKDFVQQRMDGIIMVPSEAIRFKELIGDASKAGIKIACLDVDVPDSKRDVFITSDSYQGGRMCAQIAARHLRGEGKVISLLCAAGVPTVQERYKGFSRVLAEYPQMRVIKKEEQQDTDVHKTRMILEKLLRAYPDFDLLYLVNDKSGHVAIDLWKEKRLNKKLVVLTKDQVITKAVGDGIVSSQIVQRNALWGELAVKMMNELFMGKKTQPYVDTGMYEINRSNFEVFERYM